MQANLIFYVLNTAISVIVALVCLRFLLQLAQANFYNPISQGVNRFTAPLTAPFNSLPTIGPFNTGILVSAIILQALGAGTCMFLLGGVPGIGQLIIWSILSVFGVMINLVFYALLGMIILSGLRRERHIRAQNCCTSCQNLSSHPSAGSCQTSGAWTYRQSCYLW